MSIVLQDALLGHHWEKNYTLGYSSFPTNRAEKAGVASSIMLYEPRLYDFSTFDETWSSFVSTSRGSLEKKQTEKEKSTLINWQSHIKAWGNFYSLVLDLQDLLVAGRIWEERHTLVHGSPHIDAWKNWSSLTILFHDLLEAKGTVEKSSVSAARSPSADAQSLEQLYVFRNSTEILHFLEKNPFLIPLLGEAYTNIRKYFLTSEVFLAFIADPEAIDEEQLVIFIAVDQDPDEASEALNRLDEGWWLDAMERAQDKLCITLEFR